MGTVRSTSGEVIGKDAIPSYSRISEEKRLNADITETEKSHGFEVQVPGSAMHGIDLYNTGNTFNKNWATAEYNHQDNARLSGGLVSQNPLVPKSSDFWNNHHKGLYEFPENREFTTGPFLKNGKSRSLDDIMESLNKTLRIQTDNDSVDKIFAELCKHYDRFKLPKPNLAISGFHAHVFFVKPRCNILTSSGDLCDQVKNDPVFEYAKDHCRELLVEISAKQGPTDFSSPFMLSLSNYVKNFSTNDEEIDYETYGETYTGYKIAYGKHDIASKTARSFSVRFMDDSELHIYHLHKLWVDYISKVYRGHIMPDLNDIARKIIDYAGAIYYILTAEDNETIVFWSKYYGVFPRSIPSSQFSWEYGSKVKPEDFTVEYMASWKKDYDPAIILEFNTNAGINTILNNGNTNYSTTYDNSLGHSNLDMVGIPYISVEYPSKGYKSGRKILKLRFKKPQ